MSRDAGKGISSDDPNNGKFLYEIKNISNTLFLNTSPSRCSSSLSRNTSMSSDRGNLHSKHLSNDRATKHKKSIFSKWKQPLKVLTQVGHQRFNCCFSLEVHTIEGLPAKFNDLDICVHLERKDGEVVTNPTKVYEGFAEFQERLTLTCSISSRNGPHHSLKYDSKYCLLYAAVHGEPKPGLGEYHVDLTKVLPNTSEELDRNSSGTWTTSYKLLSEAEGAFLNVSFGYLVLRDGMMAPHNKALLHFLDPKASSKNLQVHSMTSRSMDDINMTDFSEAIDIVYKKLDEEVMGSPVDIKHEIVFPADGFERGRYCDGSPPGLSKGECLNDVELSFSKKGLESETEVELDAKLMKHSDCSRSDLSEGDIVNECQEDGEFSFPEKGLDLNEKAVLDSGEKNTGIHDDVGNTICGENSNVKNDVKHEISSKDSLLEDLESILGDVVELEKEGMETPEDTSEASDHDNQIRDKLRKTMQSPELRTVLEVEEFSGSFNSDSEPESPRERLLREFLNSEEGSSLLRSGSSRMSSSRMGSARIGFDIDEDSVCYVPSPESSPVDQVEYPKIRADQVEYPKIRATVEEDLETQELTDELGFDEKVTQWSSPSSSDTLPEEPSLPSLGEGLGPIIQTKTGGYLRSMDPVLFKNTTDGGRLIMQVSGPVVIPVDSRSNVMDVLQKLGSMGLEKLSVQAKKMMPMEDVTGKTMQQMAWKAVPQLESPKRQILLQNEDDDQITTDEVEDEYVPLEELAPLAMDSIEELLIEGLRIQSGMSDQEAPSSITAQPIRKISAHIVKRSSPTSSMGFGGVAGLQLLDFDTETDDNDDEGLMGLSLTLDEWLRMDSGEIDDNQTSERTAKLLVAYHATSTDLNVLRGKKVSERGGLLGNNLTIALMVQLRDPLRDYEAVGTPMLALIQVERTFIPPNPRISEFKSISEDETTPEFKISEVHLAGLKGEPGKKNDWGNPTQQESGSCWLLANGMGKGGDKNPFTRPKIVSKYPLPAVMTSHAGNTLWSISGQNYGSGIIYKELDARKPYIRNPDVILCNESMF